MGGLVTRVETGGIEIVKRNNSTSGSLERLRDRSIARSIARSLDQSYRTDPPTGKGDIAGDGIVSTTGTPNFQSLRALRYLITVSASHAVFCGVRGQA